MRWICLTLAAIHAYAQNLAVLQGSVVDAVTKAPIAGAVIKLYRGNESIQSEGSDSQGLFRFAGLRDGMYRVTITHTRYLPLASDQVAAQPFAISAAAEAARLSAELVPRGEIAGSVLNPVGEPMKGVPVALRRLWDEQWTNISISGEDGRFRFQLLDPGAWILAAMPSFRISHSDPTKNPKPLSAPAGEEGQRMGWAATFFPGTLSLADAEKLILRPGAMLEGYAVKLRTVPLRRLSGVVLDEEGNPVPKAGVTLTDVANKGSNGAMKAADRDGRFEFEMAQEGDWRIFAQSVQPDRTLKGYTDVRVSRSDVAGISVRVSPPFPLKGFVERDEPRDKDGKRKVTGVYLIPQEASRDVQESIFHDQDGTFVLKNVYPGQYRVLPVGYVPGYYVASIWYGGQEVTTQVIGIVNPPLPLKVVYRPGAGRVTGTVDRGDGTWVVLVPRDEALRDSDQFIRTTKCGAQGQFAIGSLRPGDYYAFAFDRIYPQMFEDVGFVRKLASRAVPVEVRHGEAVDLKLSPHAWPDY